MPFTLVICAEFFGTYRIQHRVREVLLTLRFQILVCEYLGFKIIFRRICGRYTDTRWSLEVDGLPRGGGG